MNHEAHEEREKGKVIVYAEESYAIIGACMAVYRAMGCGFLEAVYQECLGIELALRGVPFAAQQEIRLEYGGQPLRQMYLADFVCYGKIILELKAVSKIVPEYRAQTINYLKATGYQLGILVNFGHYPALETERIVSGQGRYGT